MEDQTPVYADTVIDYFDSGVGPIPGPYGGTYPGDYPVPVATSVVLGADGTVKDFLSLPTGSFVVVGFTSATILDGPGDDIFIQEVGAGGEEAEVYVSTNGTDFVLLGIANDAIQTSFDLASIGFAEPVTAVRIVGLDNGGDSPGFDVVNVQGLPGSFNLSPVANPDETETEPGSAVTIDVLANDTDPEGDAISLEEVGQPANGTATIEGDSIRYTPAEGFAGTDSFTYTVRDDRGATATGIVTVEVGGADLVGAISAGSTSWSAGDLVPVTVTVTNASDVDLAEPFGVEIVLSDDAVIDEGDALLDFGTVAGLAGRGSDVTSYELRVDGLIENGFAPGTYYLGVLADSFDEIDEPDEDNNRALIPVTLGEGTGADLVVESFTLGDVDWEPGEIVSFSGTVRNIGREATSGGFGGFDVGLYLGEDADVTRGDLFLEFDTLGDLDAGAAAGFSGSFAVDDFFPGSVSGATFYVAAFADDIDEVDESDEANNRSQTVEIAIGQPDLVFEGISVSDTAWTVGETISVSGRIRNAGDAATAGAFVWEVALDAGTGPFVAGPAVAARTETATIPPGGSIDVTQSFAVDTALAAAFPPGPYALAAFVDANDAIDEDEEENNLSDTRAVTISGETELDYTLGNFAISTTSPVVDGLVTLAVDVDNLGPGSGEEELVVDFVASTDPVLTDDDHLITLELFADGLPAGPGPQRATVTAPFDLGPGTYYVGALADPKDTIAETDETNNASNVVQVTVPPTIFLDFDTPIPRSFVTFANPFGGGSIELPFFGSSPVSSFSDAQEGQLVTLVQGIFDRSGVDIHVTRTEPSAGDYHSARFTPPLPAPSSLLGISFQGIDQFNAAGNNIVAIFRDGASMGTVFGQRSPELVAEDIAHEVGHSLGLVHINPVRGTSTEIMDYQDSTAGRFWNGPANRYEPPFDSNTAASSTTHNPVYHLRRYLNGEEDGALRAAGVQPGTWDTPSGLQRVWSTITFGDLAMRLDKVVLATFDGAVDPDDPELEREAPLLQVVGLDVGAGDAVSFTLPEGTPFMLMGATTEDEVLDIELGFRAEGGDTAELVAGPGLDLAADVRMFTASGPVAVGTAELAEARVDPLVAPAVPPSATEGDDRFDNAFGDERIDGLSGTDTMIYLYGRVSVEEEVREDGSVELRSLAGELDRLVSVERIELLDGTYLYDLPGEEVPFTYRLYSAAFARVPDEPGLRFWNDGRNAGLTDRNMSAAFVESAEFAEKFGAAPTNEEFIDALYRNVLLRSPDPGGESFWLDAFSSGQLDRVDMLLAFADSPENIERSADNYDDGVWVL